MPRPRRNYQQVAAGDEDDVEEHQQQASSESSAAPRGARTRRSYSRVSSGEERSPLETSEHSAVSLDDDGTRIEIVILDVAQKKFRISVNPSWSVEQLKSIGADVHKVPPDRQRLIYRGKLLQDADTLADTGIDADGLILHLFPKPRVVIKEDAASVAETTVTEDEEEDGGARVPTIVLDAAEAEQRSSILVLGSADYVEAQNNVKLFSFMLLIISVTELLTLVGIAFGVPEEQAEAGLPLPEDDIFGPSDDAVAPPPTDSTSADDADIYIEHWQPRHWVDLVISVLGVYVALLGIKASSENTLRLARRYLYGVVIVAVGWLLYNYFVTYQIDKDVEHAHDEARQDDAIPPMTDSELRQQAFSMMLLPSMVWFLCVVRAWHFQHLLAEAEQEAEDRIRSEENGAADDEELALQIEGASLT